MCSLPPLFLSQEHIIAGRAPAWIVLQALSAITVVLTIITIFLWVKLGATSRVEKIRLGLLVVGGIVLTIWAEYWGLLTP
jgi:uncharacterized protein